MPSTWVGSLTVFMIFIMASGLAPNIGAQLAFRVLAGVFGCPSLTCTGGTVADLWNRLEKTLTFPVHAILSFGGPVSVPTIICIVLFTFDSYSSIFIDIHGISQSLTSIVWKAVYIGILLAVLLIPLTYHWAKREFLAAAASTSTTSMDNLVLVTVTHANENGDTKPGNLHNTRPENRLWFAMFGTPTIPIGLFWMGWTSYV
ncbi:hypothetical protein EYZ11_008137 [Aspergillus tanneri]|nr:hypothetical protein EYZ11_008137 [Aspergillus tanneri]